MTKKDYLHLVEAQKNILINKIAIIDEEIKSIDAEIQQTLQTCSFEDDMILDLIGHKNTKALEKEELTDELQKIHIDSTHLSEKYSLNTVNLGQKIHLQNHKVDYTVTIVEPMEADPVSGRISNQSPIGLAALGKKLGDIIFVNTPSGTIELKIDKIL